MAAIGKIRSWGPWLVGVIALALFGFIAGDMWRSCENTGAQSRMQVGEVLGKKLHQQEYMEMVEEYKSIFKLQGVSNPTEEQMNSIRDYVWANFVQNAILEKEAAKLGLTVTDDEMTQVLREGTNPVFFQLPIMPQLMNQQTNHFDYNAVQAARQYFTQQGPEMEQTFSSYWLLIENMLRQQLLADKYNALIGACLLSNPVSAKMSFDGQNTETQIVLATLPYSNINDNDVEPTEAELTAKYNEMKESFKQYIETRDIKYVVFKVEPSEADREQMMQQMEETSKQLASAVRKTAQADSTQTSDSIKTIDDVIRLSQSEIAYNGLPRTKDALQRMAPQIAKLVTDSLAIGQTSDPFLTGANNYNIVRLLNKVQVPDTIEFRVIQVGGTSIAEAAQRADSIMTALRGGEAFDTLAVKYNGQVAQLNKMTPAEYQFNEALADNVKQQYNTILAMAAGELKNMTIQGGNLIVQVMNRKGSQEAYDVAIVSRTLDRSKDTYNNAFNRFSQYVSESQTLAAIVENAPNYGYTVLDQPDVTTAAYNIAGLSGTQKAIEWIFDAKEGAVSELYYPCSDRNGDNNYMVVIALDKIHPVGYRDEASVIDQLKAEVVKDKKFAQLAQSLEGVNTIEAAQQKNARIDTISHITFPTPVSVQGNRERTLSGAVAGTEKGQMSKHVVKGDMGAYLFKVIDRTAREGVVYDAEAQKNQERQLAQRQMMVLSQQQGQPYYITEMSNKANIVDRRYLFR